MDKPGSHNIRRALTRGGVRQLQDGVVWLFIVFCCSASFLACGSPDLTREAATHLLAEELRELGFDPDSAKLFKRLVSGDLIKEEDNLWRVELRGEVFATFYWNDGEWMVVFSDDVQADFTRRLEAADTDPPVELLEKGMDQDEVRNLLGEPRTRVGMEGGQERWTYYSYDPQGQFVARTMIIYGEDGAVVEVFHGQR